MKELRGPTAPCVGGATVSTIQTPEARGDWTTHQRVHIERLMALAVYVAEDGLGTSMGGAVLDPVGV